MFCRRFPQWLAKNEYKGNRNLSISPGEIFLNKNATFAEAK
jgi:hypothetical protein